MDTRDVQLLLRNLLDRIEVGPVTNKRKLVGNISENEWEALQQALKFLEEFAVEGKEAAPEGEIKEAKEVVPPSPFPSLSRLNKAALDRKQPEDSDIILCIDFGTARSKAFAAQGKEGSLEKYLELGLGARAGEDGLVYPVTSSIWIDENSRIYFGKDAVFRSLQSSPGRKRIDSVKQALSLGLKGQLDEVLLEEDKNPTRFKISEGHIIVLYLSYLTDLAVSELEERHGKSRYVARRFALPYWREGRREWGEKILRKYLAMAQIIADTFHGKWREGIDVSEGIKIVEEVKSLENLPYYLLKEGVSEAIAAGGSRLKASDVGFRNLAVVIDIGAGTTDFGAFMVASPNENDPPKVCPIANCQKTVPQAGDLLDDYLRQEILIKHGIDSGSSEYKRINADLQLRIREYKERLFNNRSLTYILQNEMSGTLDLDLFLENRHVKAFSKTLYDTFEALVKLIPESFIKRLGEAGLVIVLTGGGASLPMVQTFAEEALYIHGLRIKCRKADLIPENILLDYSELKDEYPQLAVAMGGATPTLPIEKSELDEMPGVARPPVKLGGYYTKGQ